MNDLFKRAKAFFGKSEPEATPQPVKKPAKPWHAVSIAPGPRACEAARSLSGQSFLSREAPALPLKDCDRSDCTCRYEHHDDRRTGPRRAHELGASVDGYLEEERRDEETRDRRKKDD
ncbi:MAG: hypothetical protein MUO39_02905 [Steroidobacteraceae bacterium]|nr:hypothetical protein [Steroidobacteraceae bacterium]